MDIIKSLKPTVPTFSPIDSIATNHNAYTKRGFTTSFISGFKISIKMHCYFAEKFKH